MPLYYPQITPLTDCVADGLSFTPTSNKTQVAYYHREGPYMVIDAQITWTGTGAAGSVTISIASLPGSPTIDTNLIPGGTTTTNAGESQLGYCHVWTGTTWLSYFPVYASTTTIQFVSGGTRLSGTTYASGAVLNYKLYLPIVGWN